MSPAPKPSNPPKSDPAARKKAAQGRAKKIFGKGKPGVGGLLGAAMIPLAGYSLYSMLGGSAAEADQQASDEMLMSMPERYSQVGDMSQLLGMEGDLDSAIQALQSPRSHSYARPRTQASSQLSGLLDDKTIARLAQMRVKQQQTIEESLARYGIY